MKIKLKIHALLALAAIGTVCSASALTIGLGTAAPPITLGGYSLTSFTGDGRAVDIPVSFVGTPLGGALSFSADLVHYKITGVPNSAWETWSHGYSGDVYWLDQALLGVDSVTISLPSFTKAFYFYTEPNFFGEFTMNVTGFGDVVVTGRDEAQGFGFAVDNPLQDLGPITITGLDTLPDGFAIGEFGIFREAPGPGVPEGGISLGLASAILGGICWFGRRVRSQCSKLRANNFLLS